MYLNIDRLKSFLDQLRHVSLWDRLFHWPKLRNQLIDAAADIQQLNAYTVFSSGLQAANAGLQKDLAQASRQVNDLLSENRLAENTIGQLERAITALHLEIGTLHNREEGRRLEHSNALHTLEKIREEIRQERDHEIQERTDRELARVRRLKDTWSRHEEEVRSTIKGICARNSVEYVDRVPFKGEPDNTVRICNEYVIFDAKSPGGEDLKNFPAYLRDQAERAKKYIREEGVRKEIFLVIPSTALECVSTHLYKLSDYIVYIISLDALEPLILSLQRLEDYEFAGQLSPEERDNICRVIGKFAHLTKRRIQIDTFFIRQFMELAYKSENELPADILEKSIEFEKSEKLNPPTERRSKQISLRDLENETGRLSEETAAKGIPPVDHGITPELNKMPLYGS